MMNTKKLILPSVIGCLAAGMTVAPAYAQDQEAGMLEEVVVTGIRRSLMDSIAMKENSSSIVEAIAPEDIGKLPDVSIADSLSRLPGITTQRLDGRANVVSIRGLGPDYNATTLNGREQVTINDNRGVEFDQYPSELLNGVVVYKTPDASVLAHGLGGTVDMQTIRPLEHGEQTITFNLRGELNDLGDLNAGSTDKGYRASASYIDQYADGTVGVALGISSISSPNQEERWQAWGYPEDANGDLILGGAKPFVRSSELKRDAFMGVLEFEPNDQVRTILDGYYSKFEDKQLLRGIEIPAFWGVGWAADSVDSLESENGLVTHGRINNVRGVMRNDVNLRDADLMALGWNTTFSPNANWELEADLSTSRADRTDWGLESYSGSGRGNGVGEADTIEFFTDGSRGATFTHELDYSDPNLFRMGGALSWGNGVTIPSDGQDGFVNTPTIEDELNAIRLSATRELNSNHFSSVEFGVNHTERSKSKVDVGIFLSLPQYPDMLTVPDEYLLEPTSLEFLGLGDMLSYDSEAFYRDGGYNEIDATTTEISRANNTWDVYEDVTTAFVKLDIDSRVADLPLTGNAGLQVVQTDQSSDGFAIQTQEDGTLERVTVSDGTDYTEVLPSLNLRLEVGEGQYVRLGAARTLARARMDDMRASRNLSYDSSRANSTEIQNSPWGGDGGNPRLEPTLARQFDLSYEHYVGDDSYFSVGAFYKDLETFVFNSQVQASFEGIEVTPEPALREGIISGPDNGEGGYVRGAEASTSLSGRLLSPVLESFGVVLAASYTESKITPEEGADPVQLLGQSDKVGSATVYYENAGFEARVSARYRSEFLGEVTGLSLTRQQVFVDEETLVDAQLSYDFSQSGVASLDGLSVLFQVSNLTDEPFMSYQNDDKRQVRDYQVYGRNYMLGVNYKF